MHTLSLTKRNSHEAERASGPVPIPAADPTPADERDGTEAASPTASELGSPRTAHVNQTVPSLGGEASYVLSASARNAAAMLAGRVDPNLAAVDQVIPTWVIRRAKARIFPVTSQQTLTASGADAAACRASPSCGSARHGADAGTGARLPGFCPAPQTVARGSHSLPALLTRAAQLGFFASVSAGSGIVVRRPAQPQPSR